MRNQLCTMSDQYWIFKLIAMSDNDGIRHIYIYCMCDWIINYITWIIYIYWYRYVKMMVCLMNEWLIKLWAMNDQSHYWGYSDIMKYRSSDQSAVLDIDG